MLQTITLYADEGKILTDGNIFGKVITLATDRNINEFYEITEQEYEQENEVSTNEQEEA